MGNTASESKVLITAFAALAAKYLDTGKAESEHKLIICRCTESPDQADTAAHATNAAPLGISSADIRDIPTVISKNPNTASVIGYSPTTDKIKLSSAPINAEKNTTNPQT